MLDKEIILEIDGREYKVVIDDFSADKANVTVDGKKYSVHIRDLGSEQIQEVVPRKNKQAPKPGKEKGSRLHRPKGIGGNTINAPLPGQITRFFVEEGDTIEKGQKVCMLEAMKMENEVNATASGIIIDIKFNEGDAVNQGDPIILLKPSED